ncbi:hypothetical protein EJB05_21728, partial [Eragrostis curvula]
MAIHDGSCRRRRKYARTHAPSSLLQYRDAQIHHALLCCSLDPSLIRNLFVQITNALIPDCIHNHPWPPGQSRLAVWDMLATAAAVTFSVAALSSGEAHDMKSLNSSVEQFSYVVILRRRDIISIAQIIATAICTQPWKSLAKNPETNPGPR